MIKHGWIAAIAAFTVLTAALAGCAGSSGGRDAAGLDVPAVEDWGGDGKICAPSCLGKACGDDGCGGTCGNCPDGFECSEFGQCSCVPDCEGRVCGNDGCGCSCGECPVETPFCMLGECVAECTVDCTDKECGDDGCGGDCGDCAEGELCLDSLCEKACPESECDPMATSCIEDASGFVTCMRLGLPCLDSFAWADTSTPCDAGLECVGGACVCVPSCEGVTCGTDGCNGNCGFCEPGFTCDQGACIEAGIPTLTLVDLLHDPENPNEPLAPGEPATTQFEVAGADVLPGSDLGIWCFIDGNEVGTTQEMSLEIAQVPHGLHQLCCQITYLGAPLANCEATDCLTFKVYKPCDGPGDAACDDGNPCSLAACVSIGGGKYECHYGDSKDPKCCASDFDCGCKDGQWTVCVQETGQCFACNPAQCDDGNACTKEACVDEVCTSTPIADCCLADAECDDGVACTIDACTENVCTHTPDDAVCDDGIACTVDACMDGGCKSVQDDTVCDDGSACTIDSCDLVNDCQFVPADDGALCDDGDKCNGNETCKAGICEAGTAPECDDKNPCTTDSCDPATGCKNTNAADGTGCPDADKCNGDEKCQAGVCQAGVALTCNDNKPCTDDSCDPTTGCVYTPDDKNNCSDGKPCNGIESCKSGECKAGTPPDCVDANPCTTDVCVAPTGCAHNKLADGTACPGGAQYSCLAGECVCKPACTGKDCGNDGCGGSCGTCPAGKACNNSLGKCEDLYTCADMMLCTQNCNFAPICLMGCYGQGSADSKALLDTFTTCIVATCGVNATPTCIAAATLGACKASYDACLADI